MFVFCLRLFLCSSRVISDVDVDVNFDVNVNVKVKVDVNVDDNGR